MGLALRFRGHHCIAVRIERLAYPFICCDQSAAFVTLFDVALHGAGLVGREFPVKPGD
jgi:hypothetical protein